MTARDLAIQALYVAVTAGAILGVWALVAGPLRRRRRDGSERA